ncbi:hypothetical protein ASPFODRAFT_521242 [Aspergillus luchuensis CBS 106.47]|uniref:ATPase AAA-type core domain-containing protein n=1 Tax=Aspergillus luchuensis (strain CBS 106.47) TaxID=1137211 RepID=A0A1M3SZ35_ASPLC|nr:hypothetical protein ASPFODRAFT_521242 [Aspergillus luchuensis CBS 106.47]
MLSLGVPSSVTSLSSVDEAIAVSIEKHDLAIVFESLYHEHIGIMSPTIFAGFPKANKTVHSEITLQRVSLSALLSGIDDVSAREGHISIMTTNATKQLDNTLLCPERVDIEADFVYSCLRINRTSFA